MPCAAPVQRWTPPPRGLCAEPLSSRAFVSSASATRSSPGPGPTRLGAAVLSQDIAPLPETRQSYSLEVLTPCPRAELGHCISRGWTVRLWPFRVVWGGTWPLVP
ncbi:uncharacterized protein LOC118580502 isoform X5 [Onychomys torridus]|uniref:uncharacterized protein LOC118580502 isoform X5 n=1 Tax=Onychomys torridus TaxID=38674 RepID=UPI00167FDA0A|nr:uncharacterized protein LOC118580502 isoform X5 [Onychomys torridus]